jgi:hypothetical protein
MNTTKEVKGELEWTVTKENFFKTQTGRDFAEFYREVIIEPYSDDPEADYRAWLDSFDVVHVKIYPDEERICFALLTEWGRLQDEHCEDLYTPDEIIADMESIVKGKPRRSWTPWSPEDCGEAVRERPPAPTPLFLTPTSPPRQPGGRPGA